jgi:hypothetical protein
MTARRDRRPGRGRGARTRGTAGAAEPRTRGAAGLADAGTRGAADGGTADAGIAEQRTDRHWHPAVPVFRAAVPAARGLVGGGRC